MAHSNPKTYKERFTSFKNGFCPYCGSPATLTEKQHGKFVGMCTVHRHTNNFTNPKCKEWIER